MNDQEINIPLLPISEIINSDMTKSAEVTKHINQTRAFLSSVHKALSVKYDEGNMMAVEERLRLLCNALPSATMANSICIKAFHKRKLELTLQYLNDSSYNKIGTQMIKDIVKDSCGDEFALLNLSEGTHKDIETQIEALRSILSAHKAELNARVGYNS